MSNIRNNVQLIGHLGINPEVKTFGNGHKMVSMRMATDESYKVDGEWKEETQWHRLVAWAGTAERAEAQLQKGSHLLVQGKLTHRKFEDSQGITRYISEVRIQNFVCFNGKKEVNPLDDNTRPTTGIKEPETEYLPA